MIFSSCAVFWDCPHIFCNTFSKSASLLLGIGVSEESRRYCCITDCYQYYHHRCFKRKYGWRDHYLNLQDQYPVAKGLAFVFSSAHHSRYSNLELGRSRRCMRRPFSIAVFQQVCYIWSQCRSRLSLYKRREIFQCVIGAFLNVTWQICALH